MLIGCTGNSIRWRNLWMRSILYISQIQFDRMWLLLRQKTLSPMHKTDDYSDTSRPRGLRALITILMNRLSKGSAWEYFLNPIVRAPQFVSQKELTGCNSETSGSSRVWSKILLEAAIGVALKVKSYCSSCARWTPTEWFSSAGEREWDSGTPAVAGGRAPRRSHSPPGAAADTAGRPTLPTRRPQNHTSARPSARNHPQQIKLMHTETEEIIYSNRVPGSFIYQFCL